MDADHQAALLAFQERLGVSFKQPLLLLEAVTHRSYLNEHRDHPTRHNERLEFLGDAILEMIVTEHLYRKYPHEPEGKLTSYRSALVRTEGLSKVVAPWRLEEVYLASRGQWREMHESGKVREYLFGCTFEAMLGAIFLDQGLGSCRLVVDTFLHASLATIIATTRDPKTELQDMVQERFKITPRYEVVDESGPDHRKSFRIALVLGALRVSIGEGDSKKAAEVAAADHALATIASWQDKFKEGT